MDSKNISGVMLNIIIRNVACYLKYVRKAERRNCIEFMSLEILIAFNRTLPHYKYLCTHWQLRKAGG
jgi:hypothetical protein